VVLPRFWPSAARQAAWAHCPRVTQKITARTRPDSSACISASSRAQWEIVFKPRKTPSSKPPARAVAGDPGPQWNRDWSKADRGQEFIRSLTAMGCADRAGEIRSVPDLTTSTKANRIDFLSNRQRTAGIRITGKELFALHRLCRSIVSFQGQGSELLRQRRVPLSCERCTQLPQGHHLHFSRVFLDGRKIVVRDSATVGSLLEELNNPPILSPRQTGLAFFERSAPCGQPTKQPRMKKLAPAPFGAWRIKSNSFRSEMREHLGSDETPRFHSLSIVLPPAWSAQICRRRRMLKAPIYNIHARQRILRSVSKRTPPKPPRPPLQQ